MLSLQKSEKHQGKCIPNVLPCGIKHDGQVDASKRYWAPSKSEDGKNSSYFRGRKLQGREVKLPDGYTGVVLAPIALPNEERIYGNEDYEDRIEETVSEELAHFDGVMVWDHGALPDQTSDPYLKGVEEWISFAETIHSIPEEAKKQL